MPVYQEDHWSFRLHRSAGRTGRSEVSLPGPCLPSSLEPFCMSQQRFILCRAHLAPGLHVKWVSSATSSAFSPSSVPLLLVKSVWLQVVAVFLSPPFPHPKCLPVAEEMAPLICFFYMPWVGLCCRTIC